jgi:hypothetical protein
VQIWPTRLQGKAEVASICAKNAERLGVAIICPLLHKADVPALGYDGLSYTLTRGQKAERNSISRSKAIIPSAPVS